MAETTGNGDPQIPRESRIRILFKSIGSRFSRHRETSSPQSTETIQPEPQPTQAEEPQNMHVEEPVVVPEIPRPKNIADFIYQAIEKRGIKPPTYEERGVSDFSGTNEQLEIELMHKLKKQEKPPNGYIIGIGVSNILSQLEAFDENNPPKGIVLVNTNPKCIEDAQALVKSLLAEPESTDPNSEESQSEYERRVFNNGSRLVNTKEIIARHANTLRKLAQEGNIATFQGDFLNPQLLEVLSELPEIKESNNVIYLSNIADWIWRARDLGKKRGESSFQKEDYAVFQNLHLLDPDPEHKNYFIDTIQPSLGYRLRISSAIPEYKGPQLQTHSHLMTELPVILPRDEMEGPAPAVSTSYLEYREVPLNEIEEKYKKIIEDPDYQRLVRVRNEEYKKTRGLEFYDHETAAISSLSTRIFELNKAKEKQARGEELSFGDGLRLEDEYLLTDGHFSRQEVEMGKIYLELFRRIKERDSQFNSSGKTAGEMIDILKSKQPFS